MANVRIKRGTRAQIEAAAAGGTLADGEPYLITDEGRIAVGTGTGAFSAMAKQSEVASGRLAAPNTPALVSPAAGADGGKVFTVGAYSHQLGVPKWRTQIQRARDAAFTVDVESSSIATQDTSTTATLTWDVRTGTNYWRARDIDVFGVASEWSAARAYNTPTGAFTGGTLTQDGNYSVRTFTTSGTLTVSEDGIADVLIVAGGGGGGGSVGGGGGGGGVVYLPGHTFTAGTYSVAVGAGGTGGPVSTRGGNGGNSSVAGLPVAVGGGGGGTASGGPSAGQAGGSGGGGAYAAGAAGAGTAGQGYAGAAGGSAGFSSGGGGGGEVGKAPVSSIAGAGGQGFASAIFPAATHYGGGGGGAGQGGYASAGGLGGAGGGGSGGLSAAGTAGAVNSGGGGGGGGFSGSGFSGGAGGSGVVIIRYQV